MTWSLPEGSLISGFHSEEQPPPRHLNTRTTPLPSYTALRGTWLGSPARWCCWLCIHTLRHLCTEFLSESGMTPGRGSALRCAHPGSGRKGRKSQRLSCEPAAQTTGKKRNESLPRASPPVLRISEVITWQVKSRAWSSISKSHSALLHRTKCRE
uniref:Uncharacterized protein n=1 Tax=Anser brachyrhynchus TaxID=132585 RepID=A0A8B9BB57_9AVES